MKNALLSCFAAAALTLGAAEFEAEKGILNQGTLVTDAKASGGSYVTLSGPSLGNRPPEPGQKPDLVIPFEVPADGRYFFAIHIHTTHTGNDSVFAAVDDGKAKDFHAGYPKLFVPMQIGSHQLQKGKHELKFWRREPDFGVDKLVISTAPAPDHGTFFAKDGVLNPSQAELVTRHESQWPDGVRLKAGVQPFQEPTVTMKIRLKPGLYSTHISARTMNQQKTNLLLQVGDQPKRQRQVIYYSGNVFTCSLQKIEVGKNGTELQFYLPPEMELYQIKFYRYRIAPEPAACKTYVPPVTPGKRPRVLVSPARLEEIRRDLDKGNHPQYWNRIKASALKPYQPQIGPYGASVIDNKVIQALQDKAFYYLITGDRKTGREAVDLALGYWKELDPGIQEDHSRPIGGLILTTAMTYDWCYSLITNTEKTFLRSKMLQFAGNMENGWPPFRQPILAGHGNECLLSLNQLAMAIAVYDEDPAPFRICAYRVFEELVPGQKFVYQSGRHDQGTAYGGRFVFDMYAALQMKLLGAGDIFSGAQKEVPYFWSYAATPDGKLLPRGDDWSRLGFGFANMPFLAAMLMDDPVQLGESVRRYKNRTSVWGNAVHGGISNVMYLLLDRPEIQPDMEGIAKLPLVKAFQYPLGGMAIRTGWNYGSNAKDLVIDLAGMDVHFANHHHLEGGAFQLYYKGLLTCDLGQYYHYGTPYDWKFNKAGISHNILLLKNDQSTADGGPKVLGRGPWTPEEQRDPKFNFGKTFGQAFGPDAKYPVFAAMQCDLARSYADRVQNYVRSFRFVNFNDPDRPGALIVLDQVSGMKSGTGPYFLLNTLTRPEVNGSTVTAVNAGNGKLSATVFLPEKIRTEVISGGTHVDVFGTKYPVPRDEAQARGYRTMFTPAEITEAPVFLAVLQVMDGKLAPLPVKITEKNGFYAVQIKDTLSLFRKGFGTQDKAFSFTVPRGVKTVTVSDLKSGVWSVRQGYAEAPDGVWYAELAPGKYTLRPEKNGKKLPAVRKALPCPESKQ